MKRRQAFKILKNVALGRQYRRSTLLAAISADPDIGLWVDLAMAVGDVIKKFSEAMNAFAASVKSTDGVPQ